MDAELTHQMLSDLKIRHANRADLSAMEWNGEYTHFRRLYQDIFQSAVRGEAILWVADAPVETVIGQLFVQLNSARLELADGFYRAYIYGFRIKSLYRRFGIGTRMMEIAEADLIRRGYGLVVLNVNRDNPDARRLYERLGYEVTGAEAGIWSYIDERGKRRDVNEPAWRMEKRLLVECT
jgi:ribosomal protein S18 acetylase RimI-like enzyme